MQCNEQRQKNIAAKIDYRVAHSIGASSLLVTFVQYISHVQVVDYLNRHVKVPPTIFASIVFATLCCLFVCLRPLLPAFRFPSDASFKMPPPLKLIPAVM